MAIYTWAGATANAIWGATANWNPPIGIPGIADDAIFTSAGSTCTVASSANIRTINFGGTAPTAYNKTFVIGVGARLGVYGPTMTLSNSMSFTGLGAAGMGPAQIIYNQGVDSSIFFPAPSVGGTATTNLIANGATIHRMTLWANGAGSTKNLVITGTCNISEAIAAPFPAQTTSFTGDPIVCWRDIKIDYTSVITGTATFFWRPSAGTTGYFLGNYVAENAGQASSFSAPLIINAAGHIHFISGLMKVGTMTHVSSASVTTSANGLTGRHNLGLIGSNFDTNTLLWDNADYYTGSHNLISNLRVGGNFKTGYGTTTISGTGRSILLEGIRATASGTAAVYIGECSVPAGIAPFRMDNGSSIRVIGTGSRLFTSQNAGWTMQDTNLILGMSGGTISFAGNGNFYFAAPSPGTAFGSSFSNVSTNTTIVNSGIVTVFNASSPSLVLSIPGVTINTLSKGAGTHTVINSLLHTNSIVHGGGGRYSGTAGFYTNNFTHPGGGATIILGTTGTYTVTTNFIMVGANATAGRAFLESDMRADFNGQVNNTSAFFTSGTALFTGGELSMARSYYNAPAAIPQGFADLLPGRPTVISAGPVLSSITPGVNPPVVGDFSVGKKANFFLLPGATQNVIWAATQDIDSLGPGGIYQSIVPQFSFNDSAGVTGPTLLRTLNWGALAPPTRPAAFTFVT